jgi:hypothetical protein
LSNGVPALKKSKVLNVVFQHRENDEGLLATVFQQRVENERLLIMVFQQRGENERLLIMVFQQQKGRGETNAGRSCFVDENDDEMADWSVLGVGRNEKVLKRGVSASGKVVDNGVSATGEKMKGCG